MSRCAALTMAAFALIAAPALGDGRPVVGADAGPAGVVHGPARYVAIIDDERTVVMRIARRGGLVENLRSLGAQRVFPAVAHDGTSAGASGDGTTLVLSDPRYPRRTSRFTVLSADRLRRIAEVRLRGDFALDAISPGGDRLYLIEMLSPTRYAVRAYDVGDRRLLPDPIVDPAEADEPMTGDPLARVMSPDRRWAYTLYARPGGEPFIHALDTAAGRAKCIDLDGVGAVDDLALGRDGSLRVRSGRETVRVVRAPSQARTQSPAAEGGAGRLGFAGGALALALLAGLAVRAGRPAKPAKES